MGGRCPGRRSRRRVEACRLEIEDQRDKHYSVEVHPVALEEMTGNSCRPRRAVALSGKELRRGPPLVARQVRADEVTYGVNVLLEMVELLGVLAGDGPAESGSDRINEYKVGRVEN